MKVRLKVAIYNEDYGGRSGQILDLPEPEALRLVRTDQAVLVEAVAVAASTTPLETASIAPPENTMRRRGRPRKVTA